MGRVPMRSRALHEAPVLHQTPAARPVDGWPRFASARRAAPCIAAVMLLVSCGGKADTAAPTSSPQGSSGERPESCPQQVRAEGTLPNIQPEHLRAEYWLQRQATYGDLDAPLLTASQIRDHNAALLTGEDPSRQPELGSSVEVDDLRAQLHERLSFLRERFAQRTYLRRDGSNITAGPAYTVPDNLQLQPELRVVLEPTAIRCGPEDESFYTENLDPDFDRNNCSTAAPQEPIELLTRWRGNMWLVRTRYALGWISHDAALSPTAAETHAEQIVSAPRWRVSEERNVAATSLKPGVLLPGGPDGTLLVGTRQGFESIPVGSAEPTDRPLTRRTLIQEAMALVDEPYGWGGHESGRDCSRFLLDVFSTFGLHLPRHSGKQATAGTFAVDVESMASREKTLLIETAARKGAVLLHFPGHIMLYLGQTEEGHPMAVHSFSEYLRPCDDAVDSDGSPYETTVRVDRIAVSDLTLGADTSRRDFLSRITKVVVIGQAPGVELGGAATLRAPAPAELSESCEDSLEVAVFRSPHRPNPRQPLRIIVTADRDVRPAQLTIVGPQGPVDVPVHELGGPPYTFWAELTRPTPGRYTAVLGDGRRIEACEHIVVGRHPQDPPERVAPEDPIWEPLWRWEKDTENLYAAFVEQLFREPVDDDVTWPNLQTLLDEPSRNLLHAHRQVGEDTGLELEPDCADLPYFLRAYFAWKLTLPFAFRQCSRGRAGTPPSCEGRIQTNLNPSEATTRIAAFKDMIRDLSWAVHSSTQRTVPEADASDVYPVALTRETLRPGTVFADPYGHILVVAAWIPQSADRYGVLIGADAQPDGTVGRRRFWRGSFLFTPDTTNSGAGFKAWRPVVYDRRAQSISLIDNRELQSSRQYPRFSKAQYEGTADDFYDRMEGLINPRPLDPAEVQVSLVDALEEAVKRRITSVDNGEEFVKSHSGSMEMPEGAEIFQTQGPWEDFATPSRDLRLLVSIDAVVGFPDAVRRSPHRFGLRDDQVGEVVDQLRETLGQALSSRQIEYQRSNGQPQQLSLQDIANRVEGFEMAYNPNDCMEIRWAAAADSEEMNSCQRHAPRAQRAAMERYRNWFQTRQRPPR